MAKTQKSGTVVAREAVVINVGGRPPKYEQVQVIDRKTGLPATINKDDPSDPGELGVPYAFKEHQRVGKNHPAVKAAPGAFMPADDLEESEVA